MGLTRTTASKIAENCRRIVWLLKFWTICFFINCSTEQPYIRKFLWYWGFRIQKLNTVSNTPKCWCNECLCNVNLWNVSIPGQFCVLFESWDSSIGIVTRVRSESEFDYFLVGARYFSVLHTIQIGSGAHPASCTLGTRGCFFGLKQQGHEADHSPPPSAKVKNGGAIPPFPYMYVFMAWCLIN
jgi:hypothetical protein